MTDRVHYHPDLIFSVGTQVVTQVDIPGSAGLVLHPRGTVGVVMKSPTDHEHSYRVRFPDGFEALLKGSEVTMLAQFKEGEIGDGAHVVAQADLYERVIYRCVIGSQAYGLADAESDVDRRLRELEGRRYLSHRLHIGRLYGGGHAGTQAQRSDVEAPSAALISPTLRR